MQFIIYAMIGVMAITVVSVVLYKLHKEGRF